jgi:hypothetical protein
VLLLVIKVAWFIVVQWALELLALFNKDDFNSDSAYESGGEGNP